MQMLLTAFPCMFQVGLPMRLLKYMIFKNSFEMMDFANPVDGVSIVFQRCWLRT